MHLARLVAPKTWPISRKKTKWITRPLPGSHPLKEAMPLNLILTELLQYAKNSKEVKTILNQSKVEIDCKIRKDPRFAVGLMDTICIKDINEYYRFLLNKKGKFTLVSIKKEESTIKPRKIIKKTTIKGKKIQLNFFDGTNLIVPKDSYNVSDTLIFDLTKNQIKDHLKFEKNALIYVYRGNKVGSIGVITEIINPSGSQHSKIIFKTGDKSFETRKEYAFVIGKDKPVIKLQNESNE